MRAKNGQQYRIAETLTVKEQAERTMTGCPFIAGTPMDRAFQRKMKGGKKQPVIIAEPFKKKIITVSLQVHERIIITGLEIMGVGFIDTGTHECIRLVDLFGRKKNKGISKERFILLLL